MAIETCDGIRGFDVLIERHVSRVSTHKASWVSNGKSSDRR